QKRTMSKMKSDCQIMVFRPTMEEFKDFSRYIQYMESQGAHRAGIAKVVPPKEWSPRQGSYDNIDNFVIPAPISQVVTGRKGLYTQYNIQKKPMTVKEFRRLTNSVRFEPPFHESYEELERMYWKNLSFNPPIYGADISGSLYDKDVSVWNVAKLNTLLDIIEMDSGVKIEGVNTAYLYFGMWKTTFAWHTEDMDLYSINYVHFGAPKSWYAVAPEHGKRLERLAAGFFPNSKSNCSAFLRHKMTLLSPSILRQYGIPVNKITQEAGEFIITFPYGYHAGFNHGFNCAESTNFASQRWIDYGKIAGRCTCRTDTVSIDMDIFVQIFQPDQYEAWQENRAEVKLTYVETPPVPDLSKSYPDWRERVFQHRLFPQHSLVVYIFRSESCASKSLPKSPSKEKKKKSTDCKCVTTTVQEFGTSPYPEQSPAFSCSGDTNPHSSETTPRGYNTEFESLFDRIKGGARRMSSAKAISHEDDINSNITTMLSDKDTPSHPTCPAMSSTLSKELTFPNEDDLKISSCSVCFSTSGPSFLSFNNKILYPSSISRKSKLDKQTSKRRQPVSKKLLNFYKTKVESFVGVDMGSVKKEEEDPILSSFKDEREYNRNAAKAFPYCAICTLFKASRNSVKHHSSLKEPPPHLSPPVVAGEKTKPLIPEVSFVSSDCWVYQITLFVPDERGESVLLQCCVCCVQVHASCYGATQIPNTGEVWTCDRCMDRSWSTQCSLCCMRGGAFKPVNADSIWAHVVCAVAIPEVYFEQPGNRSSINISKIQSKRLKLKCIYCKDSPSEDYGVCLQCCTGNCTVSFHVTCAQVAGVAIEPGNWPYPVYAYCHQHAFMPKNVELEMKKKSMVRLNQRVVAKLSNGKYRGGVVTDVEDEIFHKVHFKDNSWSDNLYPQDILDHDWSSGEFPEVGKRVHVKWTDGDIYEAEYKGHSENQLITVKLDDGSSHEVERNDVFTKTDHCSQKIKRKL
uniref:[histone H3]-trimethyl-L-lysine(9) demethylase n=1 Tax=Ciona savignyi TaxID=51511 RepID=H2Z698_CIOSA